MNRESLCGLLVELSQKMSPWPTSRNTSGSLVLASQIPPQNKFTQVKVISVLCRQSTDKILRLSNPAELEIWKLKGGETVPAGVQPSDGVKTMLRMLNKGPATYIGASNEELGDEKDLQRRANCSAEMQRGGGVVKPSGLGRAIKDVDGKLRRRMRENTSRLMRVIKMVSML